MVPTDHAFGIAGKKIPCRRMPRSFTVDFCTPLLGFLKK